MFSFIMILTVNWERKDMPQEDVGSVLIVLLAGSHGDGWHHAALGSNSKEPGAKAHR